MTDSEQHSKGDTKDLPPRPVSPFADEGDETESVDVPWAIELRIAGGFARLRVQVRDQMLVGRGGTGHAIDLSPFRAQENGVSRRHAIILARKKFLTLRDLGSTNGTYLNGLRIMPEQDMPLEHGDKIRFGRLDTQLLLSVVPPDKLSSTEVPDTGLLRPLTDGAGEHILIIEDDSDVSAIYQMVLEEAGYRVTLARDAAESAAAFLADVPDLVILDMMLTDERTGRLSDGMDVLRILRNRAERMGLDIPFLVVSGLDDADMPSRALSLGAKLVLRKPIRTDQLIVHVSEQLEARQNN